jgi:hypothetical protein
LQLTAGLNNSYELSGKLHFDDFGISAEGKISFVGYDHIRVQVIEPLSVCSINGDGTCYLNVYNATYLDVHFKTYESRCNGWWNSKAWNYPVRNESIFAAISFDSFPVIGYNISIHQYVLRDSIDIVELYHVLQRLYNAELPSSFVRIISYYYDLTWAIATSTIREFGHTQKAFSELTKFGFSEGSPVVFSFLPGFISCNQDISFPVLKQGNISFIFLLKDVNFDIAILKGGYDLNASVSLISVKESNGSDSYRINGLVSAYDQSGKSILEVNSHLEYYYSDHSTIVLLHHNVSLTVLNKILYQMDSGDTVSVNLGYDNDITDTALPHLLDTWQTCEPFSTRRSNSARHNVAGCRVTVCPGEAITASLCHSENKNITITGDSYLRLTSVPVRGSWIEYASNDDTCDLASRIKYQPSIVTCTTFRILEGCFSNSRCTGTVGVLLTTSDSLFKLPRILNTWQRCPSFSHSDDGNTFTATTCEFAACPGDYVTVSGCSNDYKGGEVGHGYDLELYGQSGKEVPYSRYLSCYNSLGLSTSYFVYTDACQTHSIQTTCWNDCSGKQAVFIVNSASVHQQEQMRVGAVLRRNPNQWFSCGAFSSTGMGLVHEVKQYCQIEVCQWDTVFVSPCSSDAPNLFGNGHFNLFYNDPTYPYTSMESCNKRSISVTTSGCRNLTLSVVCIAPGSSDDGCSGNVGVKVEPHFPLSHKSYDWKICGNFSMTSFSTVSLCELKVCSLDDLQMSFCPSDDNRFFVNQKSGITVSLRSQENRYSTVPPYFTDTSNCFQAYFKLSDSGCSLYTVEVTCYGGLCSGTAGIRYLRLQTDSPTTYPTRAPSYKPVALPSTKLTTLQYIHDQWLDCGKYSTDDTNSATQRTAECNIRLCPGDVMKASLCNSDSRTISCSGDTYLGIHDGKGTRVSFNDDSCGYCSSLQYSFPTEYTDCRNYTVKQGCFSSDRCSGRTGVFLSSKLVCEAGTFVNQYKCKVCPPGNFCPYNSTIPTLCPIGSYCPLGTRNGNEYPCPAGTFGNLSALQNVSACISCLPGYYCGSQGLSHPSTRCKDGYYCPAGTATLVESLKCPTGTSCPSGSSAPILCFAGTYQNETGKAICKLCPIGSYCLANATNPITCPKGSYCPPGTAYGNQYLCPNGTRNELTGLQTLESCNLPFQSSSGSAKANSSSLFVISVVVPLAFIGCMILFLVLFNRTRAHTKVASYQLNKDDIENNFLDKKNIFKWQNLMPSKSEKSPDERTTMKQYSWNDIELHDMKLSQSILGQGSFGVVFLAKIKATKELVAIKCITSPTSLNDRQKFEVSKNIAVSFLAVRNTILD